MKNFIEMMERRNEKMAENYYRKLKKLRVTEVFFEYTNDIQIASYNSIEKSKVKPDLFEYPPSITL